ncbi:hypothetical protein BGZ50_005010 [Haplosporangium sp. Z 11]|nr:hypothetical protein BGZ50_005010 [Haplosporangium sp. Z 11]
MSRQSSPSPSRSPSPKRRRKKRDKKVKKRSEDDDQDLSASSPDWTDLESRWGRGWGQASSSQVKNQSRARSFTPTKSHTPTSDRVIDAHALSDEDQEEHRQGMDSQGVIMWKIWCTKLKYSDGYLVTLEKVVKYIESQVVPDEEMRIKDRMLHLVAAVTGLEGLVMPVLRLWQKQELDKKVSDCRDRSISLIAVPPPLPAIHSHTAAAQEAKSPATRTIISMERPRLKSTEARLKSTSPTINIPSNSSSNSEAIILDTDMDTEEEEEEEEEAEITPWTRVDVNMEAAAETQPSISIEDGLGCLKKSLEDVQQVSTILDSLCKDIDMDMATLSVHEIPNSLFKQLRTDQSKAQRLGLQGVFYQPLLITVLQEHVQLVRRLSTQVSDNTLSIVSTQAFEEKNMPTSHSVGGTRAHLVDLNGDGSTETSKMGSLEFSSTPTNITPTDDDQEGVPFKHEMVRDNRSIRTIWVQWNKGLDGGPPIRELNEHHGSSWVMEKDKNYFKQTLCIVQEIERLIADENMTEEGAIQSLQERLYFWTTGTLAVNLFKENARRNREVASKPFSCMTLLPVEAATAWGAAVENIRSETPSSTGSQSASNDKKIPGLPSTPIPTVPASEAPSESTTLAASLVSASTKWASSMLTLQAPSPTPEPQIVETPVAPISTDTSDPAIVSTLAFPAYDETMSTTSTQPASSTSEALPPPLTKEMSIASDMITTAQVATPFATSSANFDMPSQSEISAIAQTRPSQPQADIVMTTTGIVPTIFDSTDLSTVTVQPFKTTTSEPAAAKSSESSASALNAINTTITRQSDAYSDASDDDDIVILDPVSGNSLWNKANTKAVKAPLNSGQTLFGYSSTSVAGLRPEAHSTFTPVTTIVPIGPITAVSQRPMEIMLPSTASALVAANSRLKRFGSGSVSHRDVASSSAAARIRVPTPVIRSTGAAASRTAPGAGCPVFPDGSMLQHGVHVGALPHLQQYIHEQPRQPPSSADTAARSIPISGHVPSLRTSVPMHSTVGNLSNTQLMVTLQPQATHVPHIPIQLQSMDSAPVRLYSHYTPPAQVTIAQFANVNANHQEQQRLQQRQYQRMLLQSSLQHGTQKDVTTPPLTTAGVFKPSEKLSTTAPASSPQPTQAELDALIRTQVLTREQMTSWAEARPQTQAQELAQRCTQATDLAVTPTLVSQAPDPVPARAVEPVSTAGHSLLTKHLTPAMSPGLANAVTTALHKVTTLVASTPATSEGLGSVQTSPTHPGKGTPETETSVPTTRHSEGSRAEPETAKTVPNTNASYRLSTNIRTVFDVWTAWTVGFEGMPSISDMNGKHDGFSWLDHSERERFLAYRSILLETEKLVRLRHLTVKEALQMLENARLDAQEDAHIFGRTVARLLTGQTTTGIMSQSPGSGTGSAGEAILMTSTQINTTPQVTPGSAASTTTAATTTTPPLPI